MEDTTRAFLDTAAHYALPVYKITRAILRKARAEGVHDVSEDAIGSHTVARSAALEYVAKVQGSPPLPIVPDGHSIRGVSTLVGNQWIKTRADHESREATLARLGAELAKAVPSRESVIPFEGQGTDAEIMDVYPMGDPHLGMRAWGPETGEPFDLATAVNLTKGAIDALTRDARGEVGLVLQLGDFFHSDTLTGTTTKGTPVDTDGAPFEVLEAGRDLMVYVIDAALRAHRKVEVDCRNGNHDKLTSMYLSLILESHYRNEPRVTIHRTTSAFFYRRFGDCLIGATHGDTAKSQDLQKIMSVDRREDWGQVQHAYWYCGHLHHTRRVEDYGCTIETFRTLAPADGWHHSKGYRSSRDMNRITLHSTDGEVARQIISAQALASRYGRLILES